MIDYQRIFHTGLLVPDLEAAMASMAGLGLSWVKPWTFEPDIYWTPEGVKRSPNHRVTYSKQGPQHVELIQGPAGGFWDPARCHGVHHVGVWVNHIAAEADALVQQGWKVEAAARAPREGYGRFAYLRPVTRDILFELVSIEIKALMESRWAS